MRLLQYFLICLPLLFLSCNPDDGLEFAFRMEYPNNIFEIPAGLNTIESHFFVLEDIPSNLGLYFAEADTADIRAIVPREARLTSLDGTNIDFDFIFEISIRLCRTDGSLCNREIFYRDQIPENIGSSLGLIPNENNVKEELLAGEYTIEVVLQRLAYSPVQFIRARLDLTFDARREG
ncbi:MAG: hypothetical protein AB8G22_04740 [Saprospiraceae bacterium]